MQNHYLGSGWKTFYWILGIIALPIFFIGVPVIMIVLKAYVKMDDEKLEYWWLGTKSIPWEGMTVAPASTSSGLGAMMRPL